MEQLSPTLFSWASILEPATREQALTTATMPFIHPHVALMPDAHLGLGATVGSVIPTLRAVMPAAVGVDIGCGMIAVRTQFSRDQLPPYAAELREAIERAVPLSAGSYNKTVTREHTRARVVDLEERAAQAGFDPGSYAGNWRLQLGTLGSGNHFIELTVDETDRVWLFLHSGSRGVGNKIALRQRDPPSGAQLPGHRDVPLRDLVADLPSQLHGAGEALRQAGVALPQGGDLRPGGGAGPRARVDGHGVLRRGGQG